MMAQGSPLRGELLTYPLHRVKAKTPDPKIQVRVGAWLPYGVSPCGFGLGETYFWHGPHGYEDLLQLIA